jgi:hypothetical protein
VVKTLIVAGVGTCSKLRGRSTFVLKSVGWTMRSFILAPGEASTYHHVPMSCPPLKSIHSTIFSRSGLLLQTLRLNTLPPKRAIPAKWAPLAAVSKPRDLRSDKNLVYPCRLTKRSCRRAELQARVSGRRCF